MENRTGAPLSGGEETCCLITNGLGGFSSLAAIGSCARSEHGVLMACDHSPNHRLQMIQRLKEVLVQGDSSRILSSQDFEDHSHREEGWRFLSGFTFRDYPQPGWRTAWKWSSP